MSTDVAMGDDAKPAKKEMPKLDESNYVCPAEFQDMEKMKKLFAGSIPKASTDDEIREYFAKFGEIQELTVMRKDNNPAVFAFVIYVNCDTVDEVLMKRPIMFKDKELQCKRAVPKDDNCDTAHYRTKKIFFANVLPETTEEQVHEYLVRRHPSKFGKIMDVTLIRNKTKEGEKETLSDEHKGYGFITCENEDLADRISIGDRKCKIKPSSDKEQEFKKARPKEGGFGGRGGGYAGRGRGGKQRGGHGGGGQYGGNYGGWGGWGGGYGGYGGYGQYGGGGYGYGGW